jgi:methylisocitrate lyase
MIFPEMLADEEEFRRFRTAVACPLMASMTEFGKSPLFDADTLRNESGLRALEQTGTQASLIVGMQTRARLYEVLGYNKYDDFAV